MWQRYLALLKKNVLSINKRNADYVLKYNKRSLYPLVDDKLRTKQLALKAGIAVPELFNVIKHEHDILNIESILEPYTDFVIKPAHGAGGDGILVVVGKIMDKYRLISGKLMSIDDLKYHLSCMLSGAYSLGGHQDEIIIEKRVVIDNTFKDVSYEGVPDIRVIVLLGYPVMAMVRLPTRSSEGKANLHQGAIGAGIDLNEGKTLYGVSQNNTIQLHPDTLVPISGIQIPYWNEILRYAAGCYELTGLGYLGVDLVLDNQHGPMILELNARPGLNIQIANQEGAVARYKVVEDHINKLQQQDSKYHESVSERVAFSKQHFASKLLR